jgi:hypothetical protein
MTHNMFIRCMIDYDTSQSDLYNSLGSAFSF